MLIVELIDVKLCICPYRNNRRYNILTVGLWPINMVISSMFISPLEETVFVYRNKKNP